MSRSNTAVQLLHRNLSDHPGKPAYFCRGDAISYRELDTAANCFAAALTRAGITPGDRVVLALPDCIAFPVAFLGCLLAGAVAVTAGTGQSVRELAHIVGDSGARLLVRLPEYTSTDGTTVSHLICNESGTILTAPLHLPAAPREPDACQFAFMLYTSGSTGRLKGVPHHHSSLTLPCTLVGEEILGLTAADTIFSVSKLSFGYGLVNSLSFPLHFGIPAVLNPDKPEVSGILSLIEQHQPSVFFAVPTVYAQIILSCSASHLALPLRLCCSAGEALSPHLFDEWWQLTGLEIIDGIGASELSHHFISNRPGAALRGSAGWVVPGYQVRLVDAAGNDVPEGVEGHLLVSGPTRAPRYWNAPDLTRATMLPDGFTRTGDLFLQRNGQYYHRGRSDDMIKVDARWVSPIEVEEALRAHPAIADCAVSAVTIGPFVRPGAFLVLAPGTAWTPSLAKELRTCLSERLAEHMQPARFTVVTELPRTPTGKVQRFRLRELT